MDAHSEVMLHLHPFRILVLAVLAGSFITFGALLSVVLSIGVESDGPARLLQSLGFTAGFSMVIISEAALFTEVNVSFAVYALYRSSKERIPAVRLGALWFLVWAGNAIGAMFASTLLVHGNHFDNETSALLNEITEKKLKEFHYNETAGAWFRVVLSAMLGNWMVGLAAFNAAKQSDIVGQIFGIFFPILTFVSTGLQHAPANMGYLHLANIAELPSVSWSSAWAWNIIPASIGNFLGAVLFVALPMFYTRVVTLFPTNSEAVKRSKPHSNSSISIPKHQSLTSPLTKPVSRRTSVVDMALV